MPLNCSAIDVIADVKSINWIYRKHFIVLKKTKNPGNQFPQKKIMVFLKKTK